MSALTVPASAARAGEPLTGEPCLTGLGPGVLAYVQRERGHLAGNAGAIVGRRGLTLVDTTATEVRTRALLRAVHERTGGLPVSTLVNTHHHGGHTFGNCFVPETATIVGHRECREEALREGLALTRLFPDVDYGRITVTPPALVFEDSLTLHVDDLLVELRSVGPAHTRGDIVVWVPERRVVFAGDLVVHGGHPSVLEGSLASYPTALERVRDLGPRVVVPGRGPVCGPEVIGDMIAYAELVAALAAEGFARGLEPLQLAREAGLGRFSRWRERELLVGNLHRAYSELRGEPYGARLDYAAVTRDTRALRGDPLDRRA